MAGDEFWLKYLVSHFQCWNAVLRCGHWLVTTLTPWPPSMTEHDTTYRNVDMVRRPVKYISGLTLPSSVLSGRLCCLFCTTNVESYLQSPSLTQWLTVSWQIQGSSPQVLECRTVFIPTQSSSEASHSHMTSISATLCGMLLWNCRASRWQLSWLHLAALQAPRTSAKNLLQTLSLRQTVIRSEQDPAPSCTERRNVFF